MAWHIQNFLHARIWNFSKQVIIYNFSEDMCQNSLDWLRNWSCNCITLTFIYLPWVMGYVEPWVLFKMGKWNSFWHDSCSSLVSVLSIPTSILLVGYLDNCRLGASVNALIYVTRKLKNPLYLTEISYQYDCRLGWSFCQPWSCCCCGAKGTAAAAATILTPIIIDLAVACIRAFMVPVDGVQCIWCQFLLATSY